MSIEMMNSAWNTEGLSPTKKLILLLLGSYADENNQCYPSHRHIADKIGLKDTKGVGQTIREFESMGLLRIEHRKKGDGGYTSNKYTLLLPLGVSTPRGLKTSRDGVSAPNNTKEDTKTLYYKKHFDDFWKLYPRKVAKKDAFTAFCKINKKDMGKVLEQVAEYSKLAKHTEIQFIPHPRKWIHHERWNDEIQHIPETKKDFKNLDRSSDWAKEFKI